MQQRSTHSAVSRRAVLLGGAALGAAVFVPRMARADAALEKLAGSYEFAGGKAEREALARAIDDAVDSVSVFVRELARERLERANPIPSKLTLTADKKLFLLAYDAEKFAAPIDGKPVKVRSSEGEELTLRLQRSKDAVDQIFSAEDKSRTNRLRRDAKSLLIDVTVRADELAGPMVYRLTYTRR